MLDTAFRLATPGSLSVVSMRDTSDLQQGLADLLSYMHDSLPTEKTMVEIGSYAGESAAIFAKAFTAVYAVDPWSLGMRPVEKAFDKRTKDIRNITKVKKRSEEAARFFEDESLDFVYIDALHDYQSVKDDIHYWLPKIKKGCFIGGHDYETGENAGVIYAVDELFGKPDKVFMDSSWIKQVE
ncbi:MAG: class I SAM-dependent methyltransferase [Candidatus Peribacteraceae bacterium]|nr:class I SAM-dependent methyltransferase [Candidatus Peribacteraceae bacterium]